MKQAGKATRLLALVPPEPAPKTRAKSPPAPPNSPPNETAHPRPPSPTPLPRT